MGGKKLKIENLLIKEGRNITNPAMHAEKKRFSLFLLLPNQPFGQGSFNVGFFGGGLHEATNPRVGA